MFFNAINHNNGGMDQAHLQLINEAMTSYIETHNVPGLSLAISRDGELVYAKGFGHADVDANEWVHPHHRFRIASISKPVTAVAALKLRDHCGLNLDDTVFGPAGILGEEFGTPPYSDEEEQITVRQLLHHTSGWTNDGIWKIDGSDPGGAIDWQIDSDEPANPPGTAWSYMNIGFAVVGRIIERISGTSYQQFVKDEVLTPSCITPEHGQRIAGLAECDQCMARLRPVFLQHSGGRSASRNGGCPGHLCRRHGRVPASKWPDDLHRILRNRLGRAVFYGEPGARGFLLGRSTVYPWRVLQ